MKTKHRKLAGIWHDWKLSKEVSYRWDSKGKTLQKVSLIYKEFQVATNAELKMLIRAIWTAKIIPESELP